MASSKKKLTRLKTKKQVKQTQYNEIRLIKKDGLDNTSLARQQVWTVTFLEIVLFRRQYPSFLKPDKKGMKTPWRILLEEECSRLEVLIQRAVKIGTLQCIEEEIDFQFRNEGEPLVETISYNKPSSRLDYYFLFSHKEPGYRPVDLVILLLGQGYPVPAGLIYCLKEKRFTEAGRLLWALHQNIIYWLCNKINDRPSKLPFPTEKGSGKDGADRFISKREAGKLEIEKRNAGWNEEYKRLKAEHPKWNDTRCAQEISGTALGGGKSPETIRRNMKG